MIDQVPEKQYDENDVFVITKKVDFEKLFIFSIFFLIFF